MKIMRSECDPRYPVLQCRMARQNKTKSRSIWRCSRSDHWLTWNKTIASLSSPAQHSADFSAAYSYTTAWAITALLTGRDQAAVAYDHQQEHSPMMQFCTSGMSQNDCCFQATQSQASSCSPTSPHFSVQCLSIL